MGSFWERQLAKQRASQPQPQISNGPWWAEGTNLLTSRQTVLEPEKGNLVPSNADPMNDGVRYIDGHDITKADVLKGRAFECPNCPVNPDTKIRGNMARPTPSSAIRCFDCGYIEDSRFNGETQGMMAVVEGPAQKARQVPSGGAIKNNFHGNASDGNVIVVGRVS